MKNQLKLPRLKSTFMNKLMGYSIKTKLMFAFCISAAFIVILGIVAYRLASEELETSAKNNSLQTMIGQGNYLKLMSRTVEAITSQVLISEGIQKMYINPTGAISDSDKRKLIMNTSDFLDSIVMANTQSIQSIAVIGLKDSIVTDKAYKINAISDIKDMKLYKEVLEADRKPVWIGDPDELMKLFDNTKDRSEVNLSCVRLLKENSKGDVVGVLIIELHPQAVETVLNTLQIGQHSESHFISSDAYDLKSIIKEQEEDHYVDGYQFASEQLFADIIREDQPNGFRNVTYNGKKHLMVYCKPEGTDFVLVNLIPFSSLLEASNRILTVTVIVTSIAVICSLIVAFIISGGMSRTIDQLVHTTKLAALGDMTSKPTTMRQDELGILAQNMCNMMESMRLLIADTKQTTDQVTQDTKSVNEFTGQVVIISEQIGKAIEEIARGTLEQADDSEMVVEKTDELGQKINKVSDNINTIKNITDHTLEITKSSNDIVNELNTKAEQTNEIMKDVLQDIHSMDRLSQAIGKIVMVITEIGHQTNLLALNASIEAVRSGRNGQGFVVIASEIRKLADQSLVATKEITNIVENVQKQTKNTVNKALLSEKIMESQNEALSRTIETFDCISISMNQLVTRVNDILGDVSEMEECKNSVLQSIQNISAVSEETAAMSEEMTASVDKQMNDMQVLYRKSDNLEELVMGLKQSVLKFNI